MKARRETWTKKYLRWFRKFLHRLVFLDEFGAKTNMVRLYGRAKGGLRCVDDAPHGHWNTTTLISSIRLDGTTACMSLDGAMNSIAPTTVRRFADAFIPERHRETYANIMGLTAESLIESSDPKYGDTEETKEATMAAAQSLGTWLAFFRIADGAP